MNIFKYKIIMYNNVYIFCVIKNFYKNYLKEYSNLNKKQ